MSDETPRPTDETQPVRPAEPGGPAPAPADGGALPPAPAAGSAPASPNPAATDAPVVARRGFRERLGALRRSDGSRTFGLAALIASALAGIIVGGLGAAAFQAVGDDHDRGRWMERHGPMGRDGDDFGDRGGRGPLFGGPGMPGQVRPTPPPDDDDSGPSS